MVTQLFAPFTLEAKELAIQKAITENYDSYFAKAVIHRAWFPHRLEERAELRRYREHAKDLNPQVKEMFLGFLAVESFVDDYVFAGIRGAGNSVVVRENSYQWGIEERRHGQTFRYCLTDSGMMTVAQVDEFLSQCANDQWTFERQTGMEATAWNSSSYTIVQERHTRHNYTSFRRFLLAEYERTGNPLLPALARMVAYVERDEGAHEGNFRAILRIYLQYRPDLAITSMRVALENYTMPILEYPNKEAFEQAVIATKVFSQYEFGREIFFPAMRGMGFKNRKAVKNAERLVQDLPENAVIQVEGKPLTSVEDGAVVFEMSPLGIFTPLAA